MRRLAVLVALLAMALVVVATWSWSTWTSAGSSAPTPIDPATAVTATLARAPVELEPSAPSPELVERASSVAPAATSPASMQLVLVRDRATMLPIAGAEIVTREGARAFTASDGTARVPLEAPVPTENPRPAERERKMEDFLHAHEQEFLARNPGAKITRRDDTARHELATVRATGHLAATVFGCAGDPLPATIEVELEATRVVHGRIVDAAHVPVAGADVRVETMRATSADTSPFVTGSFDPLRGSARDAMRSGKDGRFRFEVSAFADMKLRVLHASAGVALRSVTAESRELEIDLGDVVLDARAWRIAGSVVTGWLHEAEVEPLAGALVMLSASSASGQPVDPPSPPRTFTTPADGHFEFEELAPIAYVAALVVDGKPTRSQTIDLAVTPERTDVRFHVARTTSLRGVVVDPSGVPVAGAQVRVGVGGGAPAGTTDADGRFEAKNLGRKPVRVEVWPSSLARDVVRTSVDGLVPGEREVRITLTRGAMLTGVVLAPSGEPEPYAAVTALDARGREVAFTYADEAGKFELLVRDGENVDLVAQPSAQNGKVRSPDRRSEVRASASNVRADAKDVVLRMKAGG